MIKKHIPHFNRGLVIGFEILGVVAVLVFLVWLLLILRLSQGPLNVDFLTRQIERSFHNEQSGFEFSVGSTVLTWGQVGEPLEFEMGPVQVYRTDKTPVLSVEKIGVQLSKRYLVFGKFVPRVIKVYEPALRIVRQEDGRLMLNIGKAENVPAAATENDTISQTDFAKSLLSQMSDKGSHSLLGGLHKVSVTDAALLYEDKVLNVGWKSMKSQIVFTRGRGGLEIDSVISMDQDETHRAYVRGKFFYNWATRKPSGIVYFNDFNLSSLAQQSEQLKDFSGLDMPLKGSISLEMDENFKPGYGRFVMGADAGKFNAFSLYPEPLPVKAFYMQGQFDASAREAVLEQFHMDLNGPKLSARANLKRQGEDRLLEVAGLLENMPLDSLKNYWPPSLTPDPRAWVTGHLSAGIANRATLEMALLAPGADFKHMSLQKLGGRIDYKGIKVDYFPPMMAVTKVDGTAQYDQKSFNLDVSSGMLGDMQVTGSKIMITDLDIQDDKTHSKIAITSALKGPLRTALKVLDGEPLQYPKKLNIQTTDVDGDATVTVDFNFPLHQKLSLDDVKVTAKAKLNNVKLKNVVAELDLTGGPMDISVNNGAMTVDGKGSLGDMPVTFKWLKNFAEGSAVSSKIEAKLPLSAEALVKLGAPDDLKIGGVMPAEVVYTVMNNHLATLLLKGDITPTAFTVPVVEYIKLPNLPGTLDLTLHFKNDKLYKVSNLVLSTQEALLRGEMEFASDTQGALSMKKLAFDPVKLGNTNVVVNGSHESGTGYTLKITGQQLDISKLLTDSETQQANSDSEAAKPVQPLSVSMAIGRLMTGKDKSIDQLRVFMRRNGWSRIEQLEADGVSGGKPVVLRYLPVPKGHTLRFEAGNAGAALSAMGITNGVRGGKVIVAGQPDPAGGIRNLRGTVSLTDFTLANAPILGRLLNAMSLTGILELLNGKGIAFKKMRADFWWIDKGQPESEKNTRIIKIKDGQTSGASLGLTFEGNIDQWANMLDVSGTIIPVSDLNKILSSIPLVGDILTAGGEGVFAATYTIKGPKDQPTVTVNPLAVLAPGILRKLFFEK